MNTIDKLFLIFLLIQILNFENLNDFLISRNIIVAKTTNTDNKAALEFDDKRKIVFNKIIKKYEVHGKDLKLSKKLKIKKTNNYEKILDKECYKINRFLKKLDNE